MKIKVRVTDIGVTESASQESMTACELDAWVKEQERGRKRYIVFPTDAHMLRWRTLVLGI